MPNPLQCRYRHQNFQIRGKTPFAQIDPSPTRRARNQALGAMKDCLQTELGMEVGVNGLAGTLKLGVGGRERIVARIQEQTCKWNWSETVIRTFKQDFDLKTFLLTVPGNE